MFEGAFTSWHAITLRRRKAARLSARVRFCTSHRHGIFGKMAEAREKKCCAGDVDAAVDCRLVQPRLVANVNRVHVVRDNALIIVTLLVSECVKRPALLLLARRFLKRLFAGARRLVVVGVIAVVCRLRASTPSSTMSLVRGRRRWRGRRDDAKLQWPQRSTCALETGFQQTVEQKLCSTSRVKLRIDHEYLSRATSHLHLIFKHVALFVRQLGRAAECAAFAANKRAFGATHIRQQRAIAAAF